MTEKERSLPRPRPENISCNSAGISQWHARDTVTGTLFYRAVRSCFMITFPALQRIQILNSEALVVLPKVYYAKLKENMP